MGGAFMSNLPPEQQKKMGEIFQKVFAGKNPMEMSQEDRQAAFAKLREEAKKAGIDMPQRRTDAAKPGDAPATGGAPAQGAGTLAAAAPGGAPSGGPPAQGPSIAGFAMPGASGQFSAKDLENAKLPPAPEEGSQMDVLLRPGLLADVEIIVDKVPGATYVPNQAVFEKDGQPVVYVKQGNSFVARPVTIAKRSESVSVLGSGVKPGETVSLTDPNAKPGDKKKKSDASKSGAGGAAGAMPTASKGGQ